MELKEKAQAFAVKRALEYLDKDSETNLPKLIDWFEKFCSGNQYIRAVMDADNNITDKKENELRKWFDVKYFS